MGLPARIRTRNDIVKAGQNLKAYLSLLKTAIEFANTIEEAKVIRDELEAVRRIVEVAKCGLQAQNAVAEVKLRAERKVGSLLLEIVPHKGGRPRKLSRPVSVLADLGITCMQSWRWQLEASLPPPRFERWVKETKKADEELTSTGLLDLVNSLRRPPEAAAPKFELPEPTLLPLLVTQTGDLWRCGRNRLLCGDATKQADVAELMGKDRVDCLVTDPPYGVDYAGKNQFLNRYDKGNRIETGMAFDAGICDYRKFYGSFLSLVPFREPNTVYIFQAGPHLHDLRLALDDADYTFFQYLVWKKNNHALARTDYKPKNEFIVYACKGRHKFHGGFRTTVLEYDRRQSNELHPTMKPLVLIEQLINDGSAPGAVIYDGFLGSGSTLIACEKLGRTCMGLEIEGRYCDVTIKRWQDLTGLQAVLDSTGQSFDEVAKRSRGDRSQRKA